MLGLHFNIWRPPAECWPDPRKEKIHAFVGKCLIFTWCKSQQYKQSLTSFLFSNEWPTRRASWLRLRSTTSRTFSGKKSPQGSFYILFSSNRDHGFVERIVRSAATYVKIFYEVLDMHMPKPSLNFRDEDMTSFDVIMEQRRFNLQMAS